LRSSFVRRLVSFRSRIDRRRVGRFVVRRDRSSNVRKSRFDRVDSIRRIRSASRIVDRSIESSNFDYAIDFVPVVDFVVPSSSVRSSVVRSFRRSIDSSATSESIVSVFASSVASRPVRSSPVEIRFDVASFVDSVDRRVDRRRSSIDSRIDEFGGSARASLPFRVSFDSCSIDRRREFRAANRRDRFSTFVKRVVDFVVDRSRISIARRSFDRS